MLLVSWQMGIATTRSVVDLWMLFAEVKNLLERAGRMLRRFLSSVRTGACAEHYYGVLPAYSEYY